MDTTDLTDDQLQAFNNLIEGKNVFLTGNAGTGKSYVLDKFIDYLNEEKIEHIALAPTGVAALNIKGGSTIHRTLKLKTGFFAPDEEIKTRPKVLNAARVIVIDEISMCRIDLFERIMKMIRAAERKSTSKQIVLVGDFFQLPPVVTMDDEQLLMQFYPGNVEGWCFKSAYWKGYDFKTCILKTVVRQKDPTFIENLNLARIGDKSCLDYFNSSAVSDRKYVKNPDNDTIFLCNRNSLADNINNEEMAKLDEDIEEFYADIEGKVNGGDKKAPDTLRICVGAKVMALINDSRGYYVNGSQGIVKDIDDDEGIITVHFFDTNKTVDITPHTWEIIKSEGKEVEVEGKKQLKVETTVIGKFTQFPLKLAYAITVHKSQGLTFTKCALNTNTFSAGQLYVGLSRCSTIDGLTVFPKIEPSRLQASNEVVNFYNRIEQESATQLNGDTVTISCPSKYAEYVKAYIHSLEQEEYEFAMDEMTKGQQELDY